MELDNIPRIFRGTIDGKAKYCRLLIRRRKTPFDSLKPCAACGNIPEVDKANHRIICHTCGIYMEDEDDSFLADAWNHMDRYIPIQTRD